MKDQNAVVRDLYRISRTCQLRKNLACDYEYIIHLRIDTTDQTHCPVCWIFESGLPATKATQAQTHSPTPAEGNFGTQNSKASRMFGPLGLSLAPYVRSSRTLYKWFKPLATWYTNLSGYRQMGFRYDDLSTVLCLPDFLLPNWNISQLSKSAQTFRG
jgi:Ubiquinol-cytochrome C reductase complex 14kD subunit